MNPKTRANLLLLLTALIWGCAFVAQDVAADVLQPMSFNGSRMLLAAAALLPMVWLTDRKAIRTGSGMAWKQMNPSQRKTLLLGGVCCGVMLALGSICQQVGLTLGTGAGKAGFITALYIVLVPLSGLLFGRRLGMLVWIAVALSVAGLYLLCMQGSFSIDPGDGMLILCAACFCGHILVVDYFSRRTECVKMSCIQFLTTTVICLPGALLFENPTWEAVKTCAVPIIYAGVFSGGMGYTLQILAQRDAEPTVASLLMSLESVFAVLAGWVILRDALSLRELAGCVMMMGGIVLAQLPEKKPQK
ncbi:MAG: DMT family transporter [Clostridia bacterium]|nr:DMT family transporter [Clostridia bacterium]